MAIEIARISSDSIALAAEVSQVFKILPRKGRIA